MIESCLAPVSRAVKKTGGAVTLNCNQSLAVAVYECDVSVFCDSHFIACSGGNFDRCYECLVSVAVEECVDSFHGFGDDAILGEFLVVSREQAPPVFLCAFLEQEDAYMNTLVWAYTATLS